MQPYRRQYDREAQEGLIRALVHMARTGRDDLPYVVITTAPSQWLPYCSSDNVTLLDVSGIVGVTSWWTELDARDRILAKLHAAGWPDSRVLLEHRITGTGESKQRPAVADLVLTDGADHSVAVFEFKVHSRDDVYVMEHVRHIAKMAGVSHAYVTDGERVFRCSLDSTNRMTETSLPTPENLDTDKSLEPVEPSHPDSAAAVVTSCNTVEMLLEYLKQRQDSAIIVDFTFPWGMVHQRHMDLLQPALPNTLQSVRFRDVGALILGLVVASVQASNRVVGVVSPAIANTPIYAELRDYLAAKIGLAGVVQLPSLPTLFDTNISPSAIVLGNYPICASRRTVFITLTDRGDIVDPNNAIWWTALTDGLQGKRMLVGIAASVPVGQPWAGVEERQEVQAAVRQLNKLAETVPLGELCETFSGFSHQTLSESAAGTGVPVIRGRDLSTLGLTKADLQWFKSGGVVPERVVIKQGDVLIQRIGTSPRCLVVDAELEGAIASDSVYVARPRDSRANPRMICQFLHSLAGQRLLTTNIQTAGAPTLRLSSLREVPIPLLDPDTFRDLDELEQVEGDLRSRADKIAALRLGLYSATSPRDLRSRLENYRLLATTLKSSLKQADTLPFQVHNFYPFPLAYSYRLIGSRIGTEPLYRVQLRVTENILAFLGSLSLALLEPPDHQAARDPNPKWSDKLTLQGYWDGGISPGHWRDICSRSAAILATYSDNELALALAGLWSRGSEFSNRIKNLIEAKNDFKHDRAPDDEDSIRAESLKLQKQLDDVMRDLAFLTRFPISLVRDLDTPRGTRTVVLRTLDYIGDHPEHPASKYEYNTPLTKNDLYIQIRADLWLPLYPFLTVRSCQSCKARETYFIDTWFVPKRETRLKSFERGHQETCQDIADSLARW